MIGGYRSRTNRLINFQNPKRELAEHLPGGGTQEEPGKRHIGAVGGGQKVRKRTAFANMRASRKRLPIPRIRRLVAVLHTEPSSLVYIAGKFAVRPAEFVLILLGGRPMVRQATDNLATTFEFCAPLPCPQIGRRNEIRGWLKSGESARGAKEAPARVEPVGAGLVPALPSASPTKGHPQGVPLRPRHCSTTVSSIM